jgi:hypothetical protein
VGLLDNNQFADDTTSAQPAPSSPPYSGLLGNVPIDPSMLPQQTIDALRRQRAMEGIISSLAHAGVNSGPSRLPIPTGAVLGAAALGGLEANRNFDAALARNLLLGPQYNALSLENQSRAINNAIGALTLRGWQGVQGNGGVPGRGVAPSLLATAPATTTPQAAVPPGAPAAPSLSPQFQPYIDAAKNAETATNLPPGSVSGFLLAENSAPGSVSKKGASGPFQLMADTAKAHGVTDPNDPAQSSAAAAAEAAQHFQRYAGDPAMVAAAYNWGSGNLDNWLSNGADPAKMPAETRRYIGNYVHAQSPDVQQRALSYLSPEAGQRLALSIAAPPTRTGLLAPVADTRLLGGPPAGSGSSVAPSAANTPLLDPATLVARAQQYNFPGGIQTANQLLGMAQHMMPQGTILMRDGSVALPPGADVAEMTKALAAKGFVRGNDGLFHIEPGYVAGSAALAGAEAGAKVPAQQAVERSKFVPLSRPGEQLWDPLANRIVASNPVLLKGVDPQTGAPYEEYRYLGGGAGTAGGAPSAANNSDLLGGGYLLPSGRTVQQASASAGGNNAPLPGATPGPAAISTNEQGLPRVQTGLSPLAESSAKARGTQLEEYGTALQTNATNAVNAQFTIDQMRRESGNGAGWEPGRYADWIGGFRSMMQGALGDKYSSDDLKNALGNFQSFTKNSMQLVTQATRAVSPRAAVQEMQLIAQSLPGAHTSSTGLRYIFDQLSANNDFMIAKNQAADAWRGSHNGTLAGFEGAWNQSVSPFAFLAHRMSNDDVAAMTANLQKTAEGRTLLTRIQNEVATVNKLGLFNDGGTSG